MIDARLIGGQPVNTLIQLGRCLFVELVEGGPDRIRVDEEIRPHIALAAVKALRLIRVEKTLSGEPNSPAISLSRRSTQ